MKKAPESARIRTGPLASNYSHGNNGAFAFRHYRVSGYVIFCIVSDGMGWEHVSVSVGPAGKEQTRCPTWEEMCWVKDQFWAQDECVLQYHPPKSDYISCHPYCLHLWKPTTAEIPRPDPEMVGPLSHVKK